MVIQLFYFNIGMPNNSNSTIIEQSSVSNVLSGDSIKGILSPEHDSAILPSGSNFDAVKQYYQNDSLARNQLRSVLDRMATQTSVQTKNSEDKMLMELYLNNKKNSIENHDLNQSTSPNLMPIGDNNPGFLSPFEQRKIRINESLISDVSPADNVELDEPSRKGKLQRIFDKKKTRNGQRNMQINTTNVIHLQRKEYLPNLGDKSMMNSHRII